MNTLLNRLSLPILAGSIFIFAVLIVALGFMAEVSLVVHEQTGLRPFTSCVFGFVIVAGAGAALFTIVKVGRDYLAYRIKSYAVHTQVNQQSDPDAGTLPDSGAVPDHEQG